MVAILVALTFIAAIVIDSLVRKGKEVREVVELTSIVRPAPRYPAGYFFSEGHAWLNLQPSGNMQLGLDEMIGRLIGKISLIQFKNTGEVVRKGEPIAVLSQGEKKIRLFSPIDGIIVMKNVDLENTPQKFMEDPYRTNWFYLIRPKNLSEDMPHLKIAEKTRAWWSQELSRLREFVSGNLPQNALAGATLADGGTSIDGLVEHFDNKMVEEFEARFLRR
jgi:glycine cleavage system H lipoate-binding protein